MFLHPNISTNVSTSLLFEIFSLHPCYFFYFFTVSGFGFNPALQRTIDYLKIAPFYCYADVFGIEISQKVKHSFRLGEEDIHLLYNKLNIRGALTTTVGGYIRHTGGESHVPIYITKIPSGLMRIVDGKLIELDVSISLGYCKSEDIFLQNIVNTCKSEGFTQKECDVLQVSVRTSGALDRLNYLNKKRNCGKQ